MSLRRLLILGTAAVAVSAPVSLAIAQRQHDTKLLGQSAGGSEQAPAVDRRMPVTFRADLRQHTLTNMRDHLFALQEIQDALAREAFDRTAEVAAKRLGMASLTAQGADEVAKYMPKSVGDAGTATVLDDS